MKVSVLGDSISMYRNWSNNVIDSSVTNTIYYPDNGPTVNDVSKTWWAEACRQIGGTMVSNDAVGGSCVGFYGTVDHYNLHLGSDWCMANSARINDLGSNDVTSPYHPDLIMFYGGTNDACQLDFSESIFNSSYTDVIRQMFNRYSNSITILCITPYYSSELYGSTSSTQYQNYVKVCNTIASIVSYFRSFGYDCKLVSLMDMQFDGTNKISAGHPTAFGMQDIADRVAYVQQHGY